MKGIYKITNTANGKFYVGSSKDTDSRWVGHKRCLRGGYHCNIILQRSWNKYGEAAFDFAVLEEVNDVGQLLIREQHYLDTLQPALNIGKSAEGGDNISKHPDREAIVKRIAAGCHWKSEKFRAYARSRTGELNSNYGNGWSDSQKQAASERTQAYYKTHEHFKKDKSHEELYGEKLAAEISRKLSKHASTRTGEANAFYGKKHSEEFKKKMSERAKGNRPTNSCGVMIDGVQYKSMREASDALDLHVTVIHYRVRSTSPKFAGYVALS